MRGKKVGGRGGTVRIQISIYASTAREGESDGCHPLYCKVPYSYGKAVKVASPLAAPRGRGGKSVYFFSILS